MVSFSSLAEKAIGVVLSTLFIEFTEFLTQGIKPALAVDRAVELSLHHFNRLAIHL